jgi:TonB family protein
VSLLLRGRKRRLIVPRGSLADGEAPFAALAHLDAGKQAWRHAAAIVLALAFHAAFGFAAVVQHVAARHPAPPPPHPEIQASLQRETVPKPAPLPPPPPAPRARAPQPHFARASREPPAPAQAARVVAQAPAPTEGPADLTGFDLVVGEGKAYAGGTTAAKGTSTHAVTSSTATVGGVPDAAPPGDLSRPATPLRRDWACVWPAEAQDSDLRHARATIRVSVGTDRAPSQVDVLSAQGRDSALLAAAEREIYTAPARSDRQADRRANPPLQRPLPPMMLALFFLLAQLMDSRLQPVDTPPAVAPEGTTGPATVVLLVTIGADGAVQNVAVADSAGPTLDAAAIAAVVRWKFKPALRDGVPSEARVRIPFRFTPQAPQLPAPPPPDVEREAAQPAPPRTEQSATGERVEEVTVRGQQRKVERGGSDFVIDIGQLAVVPRKNAENLLELAPGIFIANEGGEGHAEQVFLRGFNAEQGQSIEFTVNGVPINEVDNPDSHGYADTHFIIPELIKNLQVTEGPFDPHQGDFAVAGSARYELGVQDRGLRFAATAGSYDTRRYLALWAPKGEREGTFAAAQLTQSGGFGASRASSAASAMGQYEGELGQRGLFRVLATAYSTHYRSAGVARQDDVDSGRIDFYGSEDPSQGGDATRFTVVRCAVSLAMASRPSRCFSRCARSGSPRTSPGSCSTRRQRGSRSTTSAATRSRRTTRPSPPDRAAATACGRSSSATSRPSRGDTTPGTITPRRSSSGSGSGPRSRTSPISISRRTYST